MKKINTLISRGISQATHWTPNLFIAIILRLAIKQRKIDGKNTILYKRKSDKYTILALDSDRYRGDIDILAKSDKFRVLHIRQGWQRLLMQVNLKEKYYIHDVINAPNGTDLNNKHKKTQSLITEILSKLYKIVNIDCVTTVHFKYIPDYYWTLASESLNVSYIMLYRECNLMSPRIVDKVLSMMHEQGRFHGSHIVVHNQRCKDVFLKANFAEEEKLTIASALRMDELVNNINNIERRNIIKKKKRKTFTLFYFPVDTSMFFVSKNKPNEKDYIFKHNYWEKGEKLFKELHVSILRLAEENQDIDFIIKPKEIDTYGKSWNFYKKVVVDSGINVEKLDNYIVDANADVHNLLVESDVICGGESSTTIESLILGKRVILPMFLGFRNTDYFKQFPWRDHLDLFDVAENITEFENYFYDVMQSQSTEISNEDMMRRRELYLQCFDDLTGNAIEKYTNTIINVINQRGVVQ